MTDYIKDALWFALKVLFLPAMFVGVVIAVDADPGFGSEFWVTDLIDWIIVALVTSAILVLSLFIWGIHE